MKKTILLSTVLFATALFCFTSCGGSNKPTDAPNEVKIDSSAHAAYLCPMGYECGHAMEPGKCKSCDMDLEKNEKYVAH
jgi:predicted component of type VI protein secretion system